MLGDPVADLAANPGLTVTPARPRVLLVDDNEPGRRALARLLQLQGYEVTTAADGASAIAALDAGSPPEFVLTDLNLPDIDGLGVAHHARGLIPPPRVTLITGFEPDGEPEDFARWGIDRVFVKPVDLAKLVASMRGPAPADARR